MNTGARQPQDRTKSSGRIALWAGIAVILLLPAVAMQFTPEVDWGLEDFAFAAVLLVGAGAAYEFARRKVAAQRLLLAIAGALIGMVALIWAEAAVGVFS